jgi:hypothetical protein
MRLASPRAPFDANEKGRTDMAIEQTAEEAKAACITAMGQDLGSLYHALWGELAWLNDKWAEYVELFGTKPSRIELINKAAGHFFRIVQDTLWEDTLLHIARLTDPPKSAGKDNLTICRLPDLMDNESARHEVKELVSLAVAKADFCRDWRNRHIAHKDLRLALQDGAEPLKSASRARVAEMLTAFADVVNAVSVRYMSTTTSFEASGHWNGAASLLYVLDDGIRARKEQQDRLKAGDYREDDYKSRDL